MKSLRRSSPPVRTSKSTSGVAGAPRRLEDGIATRVVERDAQMEPQTVGGLELSRLYGLQEPVGEAIPSAHDANARSGREPAGEILAEILFKDVHQVCHLARGALPVVAGKR